MQEDSFLLTTLVNLLFWHMYMWIPKRYASGGWNGDFVVFVIIWVRVASIVAVTIAMWSRTTGKVPYDY